MAHPLAGQPPRPNTAIQYPVFNPELPKLQFSPSPLYAQDWSNLLRHYPGDLRSTITGILTYGVQIGYRGTKQFYHSNHHIHEPEMISAKLGEHLNLGRIRLACRPSFVSPLGLVPKHDEGWRRIHDLFWPPGKGLNQGIPDPWSAIEYITIYDIYEQVTQAGPGCTIIKRDIKDAFRIVPVAEDNQHLLAFQWNGSTYVECCLPFGLATAPFLFNLFAEALHWILQCLLPIFYINHYLDDFIAIIRPSSLSDPMGPSDEVYNGVTDYLRIQIDSIAMEARLPPDKLCRATLDAAAALSAASLSLKQTERLTGSLAFCSRVVRLGRTRLQSLYTFPSRLPTWEERAPPYLPRDASNTGQGLFFFSSKSISDCWLAHCHQLHPSNAASLALAQNAYAHQDAHAHQVAHAHINTTEVDAILQGFLLFSHHWLHHTLVIHTDSSTAYTGLSKGFLHGPPNVPLKSLLILAAARDIQIVPHWLPSGENTLADALSRPLGIEPPAWFSSRAPQLNAGHLKLWGGLSANTRSVYHSVQRNYEKHCALQNLSAWPASKQSLIPWLTSRLLGNSNQKAVKPDTALADLVALRAYHIDNFLDDKIFDNKHFRRLIDGARRLNPISKVRVRKPISRDTITKLSAGLATLPSQSLEMTANLIDDLNFATACRVAFAGFLRLGEFTYKTEDLSTRPTFLATKLTRSDVRFSSSLDHVQLTLKRSKTDRRHEGAQIILAKTGDGACPVDALQRLLLLDPKAPDAPLFSFHRRPFNRNNFLSTLSTKLKALGIHANGYSGHSFRKGAAQHAHDSGILDDQIQVLGRWTSDAFRVYFTTNTSVLYKLNHQFQTGSPAPLSLLLPPPSPPPS
ncbi:hypothetical protein HAV15_008849 [Penicillium sp. str. |nr:hypothetical protein HAV15_008849 [Penicillium sp. str. \